MFFTLVAVSFISATLWPLASEAFFVAFLHQNPDDVLPIITVATLANTLGSIVMFEIAYRFSPWIHARFQQKATELKAWEHRLSRYGSPMLVLAWLPAIGDLLPIAGGLLKMNRSFAYFWLLLGKGGRYFALTVATLGAQEYL